MSNTRGFKQSIPPFYPRGISLRFYYYKAPSISKTQGLCPIGAGPGNNLNLDVVFICMNATIFLKPDPLELSLAQVYQSNGSPGGSA